MSVDFSKTYLYKLHTLTNMLDALFDQTLIQFTDCTLSQFALLLAVKQYKNSSQASIASFLEITPAAVSRQVELVASQGYITIKIPEHNRRIRTLSITPKGEALIKCGLQALEEHAFPIFNSENAHTTLMSHIEILHLNTKEALCSIRKPIDN